MQERKNITPEVLGVSKKIADVLVATGAVRVDINNLTTFRSGIKSPIFTDCTLLLGLPSERNTIAEMLTDRVRRITTNYDYDSVIGVPLGAMSFATMIADRLGKKNPYWSASKEKMEGNFKQGDKLIIIEDMVTTGGSVGNLIKKIRELGGIVDKAVSIATYGLAIETFKNAEIDHSFLTDINAIYEALDKRGELSNRERENLLAWMQNPHAWNPK